MDRMSASPVSPFVYEVVSSDEASSPKQVCRRALRSASRVRTADSAAHMLTPVTASTSRLFATSSLASTPLTATSAIHVSRTICREAQQQQSPESENRHPLTGDRGSPMVMSPTLAAAKEPVEAPRTDSKVKDAVCKSEQQPNLIGDFTSCHALPLVSGRHQDLRTITPQTLACLLRGEYSDTVQQHLVVDCRYPYEYEAGHIAGAVNIYTREALIDKFFNENAPLAVPTSSSSSNSGDVSTVAAPNRRVIVFHCEFSSKRGPKLYRFTRSQDRQHNLVNYPHLTYPELYILEGGYKAFFETFRDLCQPDQYLPMEANQAGLRQYHGQSAVKSKGWDKNGGGQRGYKRATLAARNFNSDS